MFWWRCCSKLSCRMGYTYRTIYCCIVDCIPIWVRKFKVAVYDRCFDSSWNYARRLHALFAKVSDNSKFGIVRVGEACNQRRGRYLRRKTITGWYKTASQQIKKCVENWMPYTCMRTLALTICTWHHSLGRTTCLAVGTYSRMTNMPPAFQT